MSALQGHCLCGAVTLSFEPKIEEIHACHCEMCRRWTGAAFVEIDAQPDTLVCDGPVKSFASSDWAERAWCDRCGSALWYRLTIPEHKHLSIAAGLVDNAGGYALRKEIYIDSKPRGYDFAGDHPRQTKAEVEAQIAKLTASDDA